MKHTQTLKMLVTGLICLSLSACSFFASSGRQAVRIETNNPGWSIWVDGKEVGQNGAAFVELDRTTAHSVAATCDDKKVTAVVDAGLSPAGCLDIVGGCLWLVPFIGLASDGAWKLYPDVISLDVDKYSN